MGSTVQQYVLSYIPLYTTKTPGGGGGEWNGMEWNGMEWNGMEWNGMEWNDLQTLSATAKPRAPLFVQIARDLSEHSKRDGRLPRA